MLATPELAGIARSAAHDLRGPADSWNLQPATEFEIRVQPHILDAPPTLRVCLGLFSLLIRDAMDNLSGDAPYDVLHEDLDVARSNFQRALRVALESLATDLESAGDYERTTESCAALLSDYLFTIEQINRKGGF